MANVDAPFGAIPVRYKSGAPYNGACNPYYKTAAEILAVGDWVVKTGSANTATVKVPGAGEFQAGTLPTAARITVGAGNLITGSVVGIGARPDALGNTYSLAANDDLIWVADDPNLVFEQQEDSVVSTLAATDVGNNISPIAYADANTYTGRSVLELDSDTKATTLNLQLTLLRLANKPGNAIGTNAVWEVSINQHSEVAGGLYDAGSSATSGVLGV